MDMVFACEPKSLGFRSIVGPFRFVWVTEVHYFNVGVELDLISEGRDRN